MNSALYQTDFYAWTQQQATLLKTGQLAESDHLHIADEIEDMGKSLKRELESRLKILLIHLLKWQYQPGYRGNSWRYSIEEQRAELADHLQDNPSLKQHLPEALQRSYRYALCGAAKETGLAKSIFPEHCPWSFAQAIDPDFFPET